MKERPILFSGPMVRAILDGRKTQTRRIVKDAGGAFWDHGGWTPIVEGGLVVRWEGGEHVADSGAPRPACSYGSPGDRLWVRETWAAPHRCDHLPPRVIEPGERIHYAATGDLGGLLGRPSIFMPRWASRLTLDIVDVRVQRLQDITEDDAQAEGVSPAPFCKSGRPSGMEHVEAFEDLWDEINGDRATWASDPWVWAISFRRVP